MAVASSRRPTGVDHRRLSGSGPFRATSALNFANGLTALRLLAVLPIALLLHARAFELAFWLFLAAGVTDALDGFVAKRFAGVSRLGVVLDPVADKMLLVGTFLVLAWQGLVPPWLLGLVVVRDLMIAAGTLVLRARVDGFEIAPSLLGKACTFTQLLYVAAILAEAAQAAWFAPLLAAFVLPLVALLTVTSGFAYAIGAVRLAVAARS
jgi:cardiolipin synthase